LQIYKAILNFGNYYCVYYHTCLDSTHYLLNILGLFFNYVKSGIFCVSILGYTNVLIRCIDILFFCIIVVISICKTNKHMKIIIKNGTIVNADISEKKDILIQNGIISKISEKIVADNTVERIIDAQGKYIFPGGIDPHVHMSLPTHAGLSADDFYTGSIAAAHGGTTTIIDFVTPQKNESLVDAFKKRKLEAQNSVIDYSFHVSPIDFNKNTESEINELIKLGITSFKVYMAYAIGLDSSNLFKVLKAVGKAGGIVTVHAELGDEIEKLRDEYVELGKIKPKFHALSRPSYTEAEAVKKVIELAVKANCKLYIVHVSSEKSLKYIAAAQENGHEVYAETCPHYLLLTDEKLKGSFNESAAAVLSPPLRKITDNNALWKAINTGIIKTIGTDHCSFTLKQKKLGEKDFRIIPNGAGGVEHRLELLYTYGVLTKKISLNKLVEIFSTQAAKIFNLYPQKGIIKEGSDADVVIWNTEGKKIISVETHRQNADLNIFAACVEKISTNLFKLIFFVKTP